MNFYIGHKMSYNKCTIGSDKGKAANPDKTIRR